MLSAGVVSGFILVGSDRDQRSLALGQRTVISISLPGAPGCSYRGPRLCTADVYVDCDSYRCLWLFCLWRYVRRRLFCAGIEALRSGQKQKLPAWCFPSPEGLCWNVGGIERNPDLPA